MFFSSPPTKNQPLLLPGSVLSSSSSILASSYSGANAVLPSHLISPKEITQYRFFDKRHFRSNQTIAGSYWPLHDQIPGITNDYDHQDVVAVLIRPNSTLVDLWLQCVKSYPMRRFMATKMWVRGRLGYCWASYEAVQQEIDGVRHLLYHMGIRKGGRVGIISDNRYEWFVTNQATMQLGAQFVVLPTNVTPSEAQQIIKATGIRVLFVESDASLAAVNNWVGNCGELQQVLCFEDQEGPNSFAVAITIADDVNQKQPVEKEITPDQTAMIMFTAGTTGAPKGVMLSHRNLVANISSVYAQLGESFSHEDIFMSLCPWCVAGAMNIELYQVMLKGAMMIVPPEIVEGCQDMAEVHPTVVVSVAQPFVRAYNNIVDEILSRKYLATATKVTISAITESRVLEKKPSMGVRALSSALLGGFKERFGFRLRCVIIVGHQLTRDMSELFSDLDIFTVNTYGCMEAGGIVATDADVPSRLKALPGIEMRVINEKGEVVVPGDIGELLIEAPNAMQGYFDVNVTQDEAKNALVVHGPRTFVRTGDYGSITGQWLTVQGHKDVLITLSDGKVIDPLVIEMALIKSPFIKQAFVFGDRRDYLVALIVPLPIAIAQHIKKLERRDGVPVVSEREKADVIRQEIRRVSAQLPARSHVRRFAFVDELSLANGFITAKQGFARGKIEQHFVHYLNTLYDETPQFFGYAVDDYDDLF